MRATIEAEEIDRMKRKLATEGRKLFEVRAAERAGFWYTANFDGFFCGCAPPPASITDFSDE